MPKQLFPYQEVGSDFLASKERAGLHDEMGVGKTAQVIRAVNKAGLRRGVVCVPAMLRSNWIKEFRSFSNVEYRICRGRNRHDFIAWMRGKFDIIVPSYELLSKWASEMTLQNLGNFFDFAVADEAHYLKNPGAQRTQNILGPELDGYGGAIDLAWRWWHVTGTPMANDPLDIFAFLRSCHAIDMGQTEFVKRYFVRIPGKFGTRHEPRSEMIPELQQFIGAFGLRRMQRDVYPDLPPIWITQTEIDGDTDAIRAMLADYPGLERSIVEAVNAGGLSFLDAQHIGTLRRLVGEAKTIPYGYMLLDEIRAGAGKRVVYGIHVDALRNLRAFLVSHGIKTVIVQGGTSDRDRDEAVRAFQEDDDCMVFIGNTRAAGTGVTLTASDWLDVLEADWSPGNNAQIIKRIHRIGQMRTTRARFIGLSNSIDAVVTEIVARKTASIAQIEGVAMDAIPLDGLN